MTKISYLPLTVICGVILLLAYCTTARKQLTPLKGTVDPNMPKNTYYYKTFNVSSYCLCEKCCGHWASVHPRRTASGHLIKPGERLVAAPKNIKFGTLLEIPGYNNGQPVKVLDRGGAIKGNKLDVLLDSHKAALVFGRKSIRVKVYAPDKN